MTTENLSPKMGLRRTYIGAWLSLIRIQSTPVTAITLLLGYASVTGTIITHEIFPLIAVGIFGHWGVYGHNDYVDRHEDEKAEKYHKPLPNGDITSKTAALGIIILITGSLVSAVWYFQPITLALYLFALVDGVVYNYISKDTLYSPFYMGTWGMAVILIGATFAGSPSIYTWPLMLLVGLHMFWMTIEGNLKDVGKDEVSLPEYYDCNVEVRDDGEEYLFITYRMLAIIQLIMLFHFLLFISFPIIAIILNILKGLTYLIGLYIVHLIITIFLVGQIWKTLYNIIDQNILVNEEPFDREEMRRDIAKHTVAVVITMLFISVLFVNFISLVGLILGSVIWGLGWQTIMYRDPFYFP